MGSSPESLLERWLPTVLLLWLVLLLLLLVTVIGWVAIGRSLSAPLVAIVTAVNAALGIAFSKWHKGRDD